MNNSELIKLALEAREKSYSPYSHFAVGAALLCKNGKVFTGCNIEVASFTPSVCAGHTAIINAVNSAYRKFCALAIVGGPDDVESLDFCPPSGVCRQVIQEFCNTNNFEVILAKSVNEFTILDIKITISFQTYCTCRHVCCQINESGVSYYCIITIFKRYCRRIQ